MARPIKYANNAHLTDNSMFEDPRISRLMRAQGAQSVTIYLYLLCSIYRSSGGYWIKWDDDAPADVSAALPGFGAGYVNEVILCCLRLGLFCKEVYDQYGVLTSRAVQRRFVDLGKLRRSKAAVTDYNLLDTDDYNDQEIVERFMQSFFTIQRLKTSYGLDEAELQQAMEEYLEECRLDGRPVHDTLTAKRGIERWIKKKINNTNNNEQRKQTASRPQKAGTDTRRRGVDQATAPNDAYEGDF